MTILEKQLEECINKFLSIEVSKRYKKYYKFLTHGKNIRK